MFRKTLVAVALAASLGTAMAASAAGNFFAQDQTQQASETVRLGDFNSPGAGLVDIYDFRLGTVGDLLGSTTVRGGANADVKVELGTKPTGNVVAILKVNDQMVGMEMIRIVDNM